LGELSLRSEVGVCDGRVFLMLLASLGLLLLVTLPYATGGPVSVDHSAAYVALFCMAALGYGLRVAALIEESLLPWPITKGIGFWLAALGLALLACGLLRVFREDRRRPAELKATDKGASRERIIAGAAAEYREPLLRPVYVPRWVMSLWHRLFRPSLMPDRSAALDAEPRGRLDKLDVWVVVALILAILSMRVYRLGEPAEMHFDEVYHARTATEFLQDFRYNVPHSIDGVYIYEWTHPHFAKYAIAGGITLFSDDKVTSTGSLSVPVKDALVQPRTAFSPASPSTDPEATPSTDTRFGDRVFVATGSDVKVYDLQTRALTYTFPIAGAAAFSEVGPTGLVYVGTTDGRIYRLDTNSLDDVRQGLTSTVKAPVELSVTTGLSIAHLYTGMPPYVLASDAAGNIVSIDLTTAGGNIVGRGLVPGASDFANLGTGGSSLLATPSGVTNATAEAQVVASVLGIDAESIQSALRSSGGLEVALPVGALSSDQVTSLRDQITSGELPGITVSTSNPQVLVAYRDGIATLDARHVAFDPAATISTDAPATSIAINPNTSQHSYVTAGDSIVLLKVSTGDGATVTKDGSIAKMPGVVTKVVIDDATKIAHALGRAPDGNGWTVYAIETNGDAFFSDARLPFEPVAIGLDSSPQMPDVNHEALLAFAPDGSMASVDVGQFAFSWRIVGVLFGTLMAVCMYLLARILFRRRSVGLLAAAFTLTDGMLFAQSRIAMNDTYVGGLLLLAYVIFALLWLGGGKRRYAFWIGMPLLGVVLGLALSAKWVALYAIASIGVLILIRSALGRLLAILGLAAGTGVLGYMAIAEMKYAPGTGDVFMTVLLLLAAVGVVVAGTMWVIKTRLTPDKVFAAVSTAIVAGLLFAAALTFSPGSLQNGAPNYTFFIIMLAATSISAAANAYHPIAWARQELHFAIGAPVVVGLLAGGLGLLRMSGTLLEVGAGGIGLGLAAGAAFWVGGRMGFGPLAVPPRPGSPASFAGPPSPAPEGWLRLGSGFGLPAAWMGLCLLVLPVIVYIVMYVPWALPWQPQIDSGPNATGALPVIACFHFDPQAQICDSAWPAGHTGQTLWDLTQSMYNYHNDLRAAHAASSPWWAWPMDLKPVWFDSGGDVPGMSSWIHDGGNPALWWMAIFGMAFICWQAFKRRSLGLTLIAVAFFWQWLSWARIDRASFEYHFYTALPFFLLALAYFLAELWHGPSRRTWLLARVAAAAALLFPGVMWLLKPALCGLARVDTGEYFGNSACGTGTGDVVITTRMFLIGVVVIAALVVLSAVLWRLERRQTQGIEDRNWILQLLAPVALGLGLVGLLSLVGSNDVLIHAALPPDLLAIFLGLLGLVLSYFALTARNPRRFVLGVCAIAAMVFVALYPDLSGLWLPSKIIGIYYAPLPTWLYGFQFSVNQQVSEAVKATGVYALSSALLALFVACMAAWVAWERRIVVGWRRSRRVLGSGSDADAGDTGADAGASSDADSDSKLGDGPATTKDVTQSKGTDVS
jgi:dolichyl-phosphate-mannose--protein O-mannosyl transferase